MEELQLAWLRERSLETVASPEAAAKVIRERERLEGLRIADREYELVVTWKGEKSASCKLWKDSSGCSIHGYVELERRG